MGDGMSWKRENGGVWEEQEIGKGAASHIVKNCLISFF